METKREERREGKRKKKKKKGVRTNGGFDNGPEGEQDQVVPGFGGDFDGADNGYDDDQGGEAEDGGQADLLLDRDLHSVEQDKWHGHDCGREAWSVSDASWFSSVRRICGRGEMMLGSEKKKGPYS